MLAPIRHIISRQRNVLASTSSRRRELLQSIDFKFEVIKPEFEENLDKCSFSHPCEYVKENAKQKAISVWKKLKRENQPADLVIGCDTVVTYDGLIYEKPKDKEDAVRMLSRLNGRTHTVFTGVALITPNSGKNEDEASDEEENKDYLATTFHEATDVVMTEFNDSIIRSYVESGEPMDKAGAYAIQGTGATLIESIRGDYFNVVGLPLHRFAKELYYMYLEL